ncbi:hypothetical protein AMTR_s00030p00184280 [Amborella trichopoda]|uniref:Uncharacterized protein n=1 Tax=Amborella trichopoda TaxID=13333 RepID=U5D3W8_AMBTC|nr:hypothetical protein AMTR_s00030p00184280 [Amborella trichopoda]
MGTPAHAPWQSGDLVPGLMGTPAHIPWQSSDLVPGLMALQQSHTSVRQIVGTPTLSPQGSVDLFPRLLGASAHSPLQSDNLLPGTPAHSCPSQAVSLLASLALRHCNCGNLAIRFLESWHSSRVTQQSGKAWKLLQGCRRGGSGDWLHCHTGTIMQ